MLCCPVLFVFRRGGSKQLCHATLLGSMRVPWLRHGTLIGSMRVPWLSHATLIGSMRARPPARPCSQAPTHLPTHRAGHPGRCGAAHPRPAHTLACLPARAPAHGPPLPPRRPSPPVPSLLRVLFSFLFSLLPVFMASHEGTVHLAQYSHPLHAGLVHQGHEGTVHHAWYCSLIGSMRVPWLSTLTSSAP
jgi:hypothetical protein